MKFEVILESCKLEKQVSIEADTHEEAVAKAKAMNLTETVPLRPTWVDTAERVKETDQLEHEVEGYCDECMKPIVNRPIPGQPWNHRSVSEHGGLMCYPCSQKICRDCNKPVGEKKATSLNGIVICEECYRKGYREGLTLSKDGEWYHGAEH